MKFGLILSDTSRSKSYLNTLLKNKFYPSEVIFYSDTRNNKILQILKKKLLNFKYFKVNNINKAIISNYIIKSKINKFIYSGYPGELVKREVVNKKFIIHIHAGKIPDFKGSTTIYYSILLKKKVFCTALRLNEKIDSGRILLIKKYRPPLQKKLIESTYDDYIRANTLIDLLKLKKYKHYKKKKIKFLNYYIAHPIIRALVSNKKNLMFFKNLYNY